jgi:hypothetical protein
VVCVGACVYVIDLKNKTYTKDRHNIWPINEYELYFGEITATHEAKDFSREVCFLYNKTTGQLYKYQDVFLYDSNDFYKSCGFVRVPIGDDVTIKTPRKSQI